MNKKNDDLKPFRAGDMRFSTKKGEAKGKISEKKYLKLSFPFLEKLLESTEEEVNDFLKRCENTCKNLDSALKSAKGEDEVNFYQSVLSAYGHSLYLFNQLLEEKFKMAEKEEK